MNLSAVAKSFVWTSEMSAFFVQHMTQKPRRINPLDSKRYLHLLFLEATVTYNGSITCLNGVNKSAFIYCTVSDSLIKHIVLFFISNALYKDCLNNILV
jgi:hypothetical protein